MCFCRPRTLLSKLCLRCNYTLKVSSIACSSVCLLNCLLFVNCHHRCHHVETMKSCLRCEAPCCRPATVWSCTGRALASPSSTSSFSSTSSSSSSSSSTGLPLASRRPPQASHWGLRIDRERPGRHKTNLTLATTNSCTLKTVTKRNGRATLMTRIALAR